MTAGEEAPNGVQSKGFSGLSSLVSVVDTSLPPPNKPEANGSGETSGVERLTTSARSSPGPQRNQQQPDQAQSSPYSGSPTARRVLALAAVIGVFWLIGESTKDRSSRPSSVYTPSLQKQELQKQASQPLDQFKIVTPRIEEPRVTSGPDESKPPVGQDLVFSTAQIRYCVAEEIRMNGAGSAVNNYSDTDVTRFNEMVEDYNSRCGSFRHRTGALESARRDVEPYRSQLQVEGRSRFARSPSTGSLLAPSLTRPAPDPTTKQVQVALAKLGYDAGPADGLMGTATRAAIISFQRDSGLAATGEANQALILQLQQASPRGKPDSHPASSSKQFSPAKLHLWRLPVQQTSTSTVQQRTIGALQINSLPLSGRAVNPIYRDFRLGRKVQSRLPVQQTSTSTVQQRTIGALQINSLPLSGRAVNPIYRDFRLGRKVQSRLPVQQTSTSTVQQRTIGAFISKLESPRALTEKRFRHDHLL